MRVNGQHKQLVKYKSHYIYKVSTTYKTYNFCVITHVLVFERAVCGGMCLVCVCMCEIQPWQGETDQANG